MRVINKGAKSKQKEFGFELILKCCNFSIKFVSVINFEFKGKVNEL